MYWAQKSYRVKDEEGYNELYLWLWSPLIAGPTVEANRRSPLDSTRLDTATKVTHPTPYNLQQPTTLLPTPYYTDRSTKPHITFNPLLYWYIHQTPHNHQIPTIPTSKSTKPLNIKALSDFHPKWGLSFVFVKMYVELFWGMRQDGGYWRVGKKTRSRNDTASQPGLE